MVSVRCAVYGSYGGRVVRSSLLSNCPGAPTLGRLLALRDVLLRFLPGFQRTARLDSIPGEVLRVKSGPRRTRGPFLAFSAQLPFCRSSAAGCFDRACAEPVQARLYRQHRRAPAGVSCLVSWHELCPRRDLPPAMVSPGTRSCQGSPACGARFWGSVPPQHRRVLGNEHVPQQQGCSVAVVPLRALREPGSAFVHR